jgi:tetratricopeptide (TPR) repeat protein
MRSTHELEKKRLGPEHSGLVLSLTNMAAIEYKLGKLEDALALLHRARELLSSPDAKRADLGQALSLQALIQNRLGNLPEAIDLSLQTIEVFKELFGEDHPNIWRTKANLANIYMALEKWDETLEIQEGFLAWTIERYGADNQTAVLAKLNLAGTMVQVHYEDGEVQRAQVLLDELARDLPKGDPTHVGVRVMQGNAHLARKEYSQAATAFEQTLKLAEVTPNPEPSFPATTTGAWADALWQAGQRSRALAVARRALLLYDKLLPGMAEMRAEQEAWLVEKERELAD